MWVRCASCSTLLMSFLIIALSMKDFPSGEVCSIGLLKQSDVCRDLCGRAADQALLRLDLLTEPHLEMLPGKAERGQVTV